MLLIEESEFIDAFPTEIMTTGSIDQMVAEEKKDDIPSSPLRILIYTACYNIIDGVTLTIRKLESTIINEGGHVCVVTTRSGNNDNTHLVPEHPNRRIVWVEDAIPVPFTEEEKSKNQTYFLGRSLCRQVLKEIKGFAPNLVHLTVPDITGLEMIDYARRNNIPLMGTYHSNIAEYLDHYGVSFMKPLVLAFFRHSYNFLQALYVPTPYMKRFLTDSSLYKLHRYTDLKVWGRGIDLEKFNPNRRSEKFRARLNISPSEVVICFVGRLVYEKRPDIFANVIQRLHHSKVSFKAIVIGGGQYMPEMEKLPNTICLGWISNSDELAIAYASSDIFLFPSSLETFGNVTLEASACGLPIVVEAGCSGHLMKNGVTGFACPAGNENAFYNATLALIVNLRMREQFSVASRQHSYKFEQSIVLSDMIQNYHRTIEEFDLKYHSSHYNRDRLWKKQEGCYFDSGLVVYPMSLWVVLRITYFLVKIGTFLFAIFRLFRSALRLLLPLLRLFQCISRTCKIKFRHSKLVLQKVFNHVSVVRDIENSTKGSSKSSQLASVNTHTKLNDPSNRSKRNFNLHSSSPTEKYKRSASAAPREMKWLVILVQHFANFIIFNIRMQSIIQVALTSFFSTSNNTFNRRKKRKDDFYN